MFGLALRSFTKKKETADYTRSVFLGLFLGKIYSAVCYFNGFIIFKFFSFFDHKKL